MLCFFGKYLKLCNSVNGSYMAFKVLPLSVQNNHSWLQADHHTTAHLAFSPVVLIQQHTSHLNSPDRHGCAWWMEQLSAVITFKALLPPTVGIEFFCLTDQIWLFDHSPVSDKLHQRLKSRADVCLVSALGKYERSVSSCSWAGCCSLQDELLNCTKTL